MDSNIELNISFRFLVLSNSQVLALKKYELEPEFGVHFKTKSTTASVSLNEDNVSIISEFIKENKVQKENTDIFISFVTEYDSRIIDVPNYVNEAILKLGSKLVLSYTIV